MPTNPLAFRVWWKGGSYGGQTYASGWCTAALITQSGRIAEEDYEEKGTIFDPENYVVERFTGLSDKNGKDIYEGDIIRDREWRSHIVQFEVEWCDTFTRVVAWEKSGGWNIQERQLSGRPYLEVIGNIHENPELIPQ